MLKGVCVFTLKCVQNLLMGGSPETGVVCALGLNVQSVTEISAWVKMMDFVLEGFYSRSCVQLYLGVVTPEVKLFEHLMWVNKWWVIQC